MQATQEQVLKPAHEILNELAEFARSNNPIRIAIAEVEPTLSKNMNWSFAADKLPWAIAARLDLALERLRRKHPFVEWEDVPPSNRVIARWVYPL